MMTTLYDARAHQLTPTRTRTALYLRQSQALNDDEAAVQRQEKVCREAAGPRNLDIVAVYRDNDVSATSNRSRPDYVKMLQAWEAGEFEAIICYDLDRLYRKPRDLEDLIEMAEKRGLKLHTVTGEADLNTDNGRLFARIKAAVAKAETERKSARQKLRNQQDVENPDGAAAYWMGRRRPFGYDTDGTINEAEGDAIRDAYSAVIAGEGLMSIARRWNEAGLLTPQYARVGGNKWSVNTVKQVLLAPRNAAIRVYYGQEFPGNWEPIVDEVAYRTVVMILKQRAAARGGKRPSSGLLSWVAVCGVCGKRVVGSRNKQGTRTYRCEGVPDPGLQPSGSYGSTKSCLNRVQEPIDSAVTAAVLEVMGAPDASKLLLNQERPDLFRLTAERDALRVKLDDVANDFYKEELITRQQFVSTTQTLKAELADLEKQMVHQGKDEVLGDLIRAEDVRVVWESLPLDRKRAVVRALFRVEVLPRSYGAGGNAARSFNLVALVGE